MKGLKHFKTKTYKDILSEMCKRVGVAPDEIDFSEPQWFMKYTWTREEQEEYKKWLMDYFVLNKKSIGEISKFPRLFNKKSAEKLANEVIFNYGWREQ